MDDALHRAIFAHEPRHWWFSTRRGIVRDALERWGGLRPGDDVLDVGCGAGALLADLARAGYRARGVDASPLAVELARSRGVDVSLGDLAALRARGEAARGVLLLDVLEHVDDDVALARDAAALLAPGGCLVVTVPAFLFLWSSHDVANHHRRRYDAARLEAVLDAAGLDVVHLTYFNALLFPLAVARRLAFGRARADAAERVASPPATLNAALRAVFEVERRALGRATMPFGSSLLAVARAQRAGQDAVTRGDASPRA